jgi:hypothetical protein
MVNCRSRFPVGAKYNSRKQISSLGAIWYRSGRYPANLGVKGFAPGADQGYVGSAIEWLSISVFSEIPTQWNALLPLWA